jgi:prevent-host-death family protein
MKLHHAFALPAKLFDLDDRALTARNPSCLASRLASCFHIGFGLTECVTCSTLMVMRRAGMRKVRQNLSALLKEIRQGREIEITDRGEPVARLVPPVGKRARPFNGRAAFRAKMPKLTPPLSKTLVDDREDRL